jgi:hypothetical protein
VEWQPTPLDAFKFAMIEEQRLIYEFDAVRACDTVCFRLPSRSFLLDP